MESLGWEWGRLFTMIAAAGVGSAAVQALMPVYRDHRMRRKQAVYMAMRLAVIMENFAWACADFVQNNRNARTPAGDEYPAWETALPELLAYPEDSEGWRAIAPKLAGRVFGLRNKTHQSTSTIRQTLEADKPELGWMLDEQAAARGLEAWRLAVDLRRAHRIEPVELEWNYPDYLQTALEAATTRRGERRT